MGLTIADVGVTQILLDHRFDRLERKLDQFIDVQLRTNQLVEVRLTALERPERRQP